MSEVFHSAGVPRATRCSEAATGTRQAQAVAQRLLELGAACTDSAGAMSYAACCCDEAATYLDDEPPRVGDALEVARLGLAHVGTVDLRELPADVAALLAAELILRDEVAR